MRVGVWNFLGPSFSLVLLSTFPAQGQPVYLHSPSEQKSTADLAANLDAARTAHLAALDGHDANLKAAMQAEQAAVVRRNLARRDVIVSEQINGDNRKLVASLSVRLANLTSDSPLPGRRPQSNRGSVLAEDVLQSDILAARKARLELERRAGEARRITALAALRGEAAKPCDQTRSPAGELPTGAAASDSCLTVRQTYEALLKKVPCGIDETSRSILAMAARVKFCWNETSASPVEIQGEVGEALKQNIDLVVAVARQEEASTLVTQELKKLEAYIACQKEKAAQPSATEQIAAGAGEIDAFLVAVSANELEKLDSDAAGGGKNPSVCTDANGGKVEPSSLKGLFSALRTIITASNTFNATRGVGAAAAAAALDFRADVLGELLQAAANPQSPPDGRAATIVAALVRSAAPLQTLAQVRAGTLPDTSGVLVALAEARMRATSAGIEAERLKRLVSLSEQKISALTSETLLVRQSLSALYGGAPNTDRAVVLYATSVERGRIPAEVVDLRMDNIEFEMWSRRERAAVEAGYAALAPAAAELKAYGEGGIKADTIARFLNVAGLAAIAGTN